MSGIEVKCKEILNSDSNKVERISMHDHGFQELWNMFRRSKIRIHGVEEGAERKTKGIENLCNKIIAENFPNLGKVMDIQAQEAIRTPNGHHWKRTSKYYIIVKM
jgi:hypothetical protein